MIQTLLALLLTLHVAFAASWTNPLIEQRADPCILKHDDGYYYFTATAPEYDRIVLRRAKTLDGLTGADEKVVWKRHEKGPMSWHIWAPELHRVDGKWYIHFAAGQAEDVWKIRMWVLENDAANPLEGEWKEKGEIKTKWDSFSLDATTFEHGGKRYLCWAQHDPDFDGNTDLYIAEMTNPWTIKQPQVRITRPEYTWETIGHKVNEGPAFLHRNGKVFISYSASATDHNYCLGLLWADEKADLLRAESWHKSPTPVFVSSPPNGQWGPGHNQFTVAEDGKTDLLVYHARQYRDIQGEPLRNPDRHTRVQVLNWRADGFPDFGEPVKDGPVELD